MATFTIDSENNNIVAHAGVPASAAHQQTFASEKELARLAAGWPSARLIEVWNSFAGVTPFDDLKPVKKFTNRQIAVRRIWQALKRLSPAFAPQAEPVAHMEKGGGEGFGQEPEAGHGAHGRRRSAGQQEGPGHRHDEAPKRHDAGPDHGGHGLAEAHRPRLREPPGQQGRRKDRIGQEPRRGTLLPHREIAFSFFSVSLTPSSVSAGGGVGAWGAFESPTYI
jgi:hypothetical protein